MNIFKNTTENDGSDLLLMKLYKKNNNREMNADSLHAKVSGFSQKYHSGKNNPLAAKYIFT